MADRPAVAQACTETFAAWSGAQPTVLAWAPGRINVLGGHTDYNEGLALPAAINRWVAVALRPREDRLVRVCSPDFSDGIQGTLDRLPVPTASWQRFVTGLIQVFGARHRLDSGFDALFVGDVPDGAGLSSSAALTVAWLNLFRAWTGADFDDWTLARMSQQVEHEHLGVECGLLDQVACQMSQPGHVLKVDFRDLSISPVSIQLKGVSWVVLHSGVRRELAHCGYADRVSQCAHGMTQLKAQNPGLQHLRDAEISQVVGDEVWVRRLRHVISENHRVERAADCIEAGDREGLGALMLQTHASLRDDYEVSCPELDALVKIAASDPDCWGCRMVGGGFGGCTLNLVRAGEADAFIERVLQAYRQHHHHEAVGYCFNLCGGAAVA